MQKKSLRCRIFAKEKWEKMANMQIIIDKIPHFPLSVGGNFHKKISPCCWQKAEKREQMVISALKKSSFKIMFIINENNKKVKRKTRIFEMFLLFIDFLYLQ